jgi:hypothetical protein
MSSMNEKKLMIRSFVPFLLVVLVIPASASDDRPFDPTQREATPQPSLSKRKGLLSPREVKEFHAVTNRTKADTLHRLGHPAVVRKDGTIETWTYHWGTFCQVTFSRGRVIRTFYLDRW